MTPTIPQPVTSAPQQQRPSAGQQDHRGLQRLGHLGLVTLACLSLTSAAAAQMQEDLIPPARDFVSPENLILELRVGPYSPDDPTGAFDRILGGDEGPYFELEMDMVAYRLENVLYATAGGAIGYGSFSEAALVASTQARASEESSLDMIPLSLLATVRIDAMARLLGVPLIVTGKVGYTWNHWTASTGGVEDESGVSVGLRWGAQLALDLDFFEPRAARAMDEEWGINHSYAFFELFQYHPTDSSLELGGLQWIAGLGFVL